MGVTPREGDTELVPDMVGVTLLEVDRDGVGDTGVTLKYLGRRGQ